MILELVPGEVEIERDEAFNYRGTFDQDDGHYVFTNRRLVHVTNPWYLSPRGRAALIYYICTMFGYKPVHITQQVELAHIASLQFMSYMFTTGYRIRSVYGQEFELHIGITSTAEPWRDRLLGLIAQASPGCRIIPQGDVIFIQR